MLASSCVSQTTSLRLDAHWKKMFLQTCGGWGEAPQETKERWCERTSCFVEGDLKIRIRESLFHVKEENWDQNAPSNSPKAPGTKSKFGKETVHRKEFSNVWTSSAQSLRTQIRRRSLEETLHQQRCASRVARDLANTLTSSRMWTQLRFIFLLNPR